MDGKLRALNRGAVLIIVPGGVLAIFSTLMIGAGIERMYTMTDVMLVAVFACLPAAGIFLVVRGIGRRRLTRRYVEYAAMLKDCTEKTVGPLAVSMGVSEQKARKTLSKMASLGLLPGYHAQGEKAHGHGVLVRCPGCGAKNEIQSGAVGKCKYCGSPIDKERSA